MKNSKANGRILRIVSCMGKFRLMWVQMDNEDDVVESILLQEDVTFSERNISDLKELMLLVEEAKSLPVIVLNAANRHLYVKEEQFE